jgi:endopeptidase La
MLPMEFDHIVLDSLPVPSQEDARRVVHVLKAIVVRRVVPHFRKSRGTEPTRTARATERLGIERLEDEGNRVRCVDLLTRTEEAWTIHIHERVFDYLAFVIPTGPEERLGNGTPQEHQVLAFAEFLLRHELEHVLYEGRTERQVLESDTAFILERQSADPTYYRMLRRALSDDMNGLKGRPFADLFDRAENGEGTEDAVGEMLNTYALVLADIPDSLLQRVFPDLDPDLATRVLGASYRRSKDTSYPLLKRTSFLQTVLTLFELAVTSDAKIAQEVFQAFRDNWGLIGLLQELGIPEARIENKTVKELFDLFKDGLKRYSEEAKSQFYAPPPPVVSREEGKPAVPAVKTLKDRIEDARNNPSFPDQALGVIDKNKINAVGHSGSKFSELIETLLAIPWGKIHKIQVSALDFERGLDSSHYGLHKPKETICDFFSNLIWRYQRFDETAASSWKRNGSAFLFVGPPGVGKTSLAISVAQNLHIPYHKLSLGGMRDEADLRGHGFTYEGSKPGAIVQGIIKMGVMNGMFIMDEADKTEKFAIATLLEILDPEQNHLFHDKYTETTVDIDLSNCHFMLTANTLETVPPAVVNRCEVVQLDRYSIEEKVEIARHHLVERVRSRYQIGEDRIFFEPTQEQELFRHLVNTYTYEAGVRELERIIRALFLRAFRREILTGSTPNVRITREKIKEYLDTPKGPRQINEEDRIGEVMGLGVNVERGVGTVIPIQATPIRLGPGGEGRPGYLSMVHATGNIQKIMDESRTVATTAILHNAAPLGIDLKKADVAIHLHFMGGSTPKDGPSAGGAIALALASVLAGKHVRRDVAVTAEIDTQGRLTGIGALATKLEVACDAGCKTVIIPKENLWGEDSVERLSEALKRELHTLTYEEWKGPHDGFDYDRHVLQIVAVDHIRQAAEVAFIDEQEVQSLESAFLCHGRHTVELLTQRSQPQRSCIRMMYLKDLSELEIQGPEDPCLNRDTCILLTRPEVKEGLIQQSPRIVEAARFREFDPSTQDLRSVLEDLAESVPIQNRGAVRIAMLAPFFFFISQKACLDEFSTHPAFGQLELFANNYTAQGLKIKGFKRLLNRVYHYLSRLDPIDVNSCPFLGIRDGIHVLDLSFIPEKYRLDTKRAAEILGRALKRWLDVVENG